MDVGDPLDLLGHVIAVATAHVTPSADCMLVMRKM